ncbi:Allantoicase [Chionoecetes opilio]|uniref:Allantoate amidinohydrolase n=1 Tax=Chionoecetes opilio TaxID=41210 RepID=A0A8J4YHJ2_CHIOP|nr:Allantoicase [Chionoecetes opilio]
MAQRPSQTAKGEARPKFAELNNLASEKLGARIVFATDDWFAVADNLLQDSEAEWREGEFTECGKWMDGWETRRKRKSGHDWCIIKLGVAGVVEGVDVDTSFFTGNYAPRVSLQGATLTEQGVADDNSRHRSPSGYIDTCHTFLPATCATARYTHLRLNIYPDGGIARLRVFGRALSDVNKVSPNEAMDLVSLRQGGVCLGYSDAHYGHPRNLISPWRPLNMADGWETARRLDRPPILTEGANGVLQLLGHEWALFKLGLPGKVDSVEVDTHFFKGNFPDSCRLDGCCVKEGEEVPDAAVDGAPWLPILQSQKLRPDTHHAFGSEVEDAGLVTHVRLVMAPDGGISRLRIMGTVSPHALTAS